MTGSLLKHALLIICLSLMPALAQAQKISVDYDKEADFSRYKTYSWLSGQLAPNPLVHKRIVDAIDRQLASKGWTKTDSSPSATIVYNAAVDEQKELHGWGNGPRWNSMGTVSVDTILIGQLVVDIYDTATQQLLWRGFASDTATDKTDKNEKKIINAVAKLFKQFPPAVAASRN